MKLLVVACLLLASPGEQLQASAIGLQLVPEVDSRAPAMLYAS